MNSGLLAVCIAACLCAAYGLPAGSGYHTSYEPIKFNYTCDECYRMSAALRDYCTHNEALVTRELPASHRFNETCRDFAYPVTPDRTILKEKCEFFSDFVSRLYCPIDPCVHVTTAMNIAPNALCRLMKCTEPTDEPKVEEPTLISPPLTCAQYITAMRSSCLSHDDDSATSNSTFRVCDQYSAYFEREGCEQVMTRLSHYTYPNKPCEMMRCDMSLHDPADMCSKILNLPPTTRMPTPSYFSYLALINNTQVTLKDNGINITTATYGPSCRPMTTNNLIAQTKALCDRHITCTVPNPRFGDVKELWGELKCNQEFEIFYSCVSGGKVHRLFVPESAPFETLKLDCSRELPLYPELDAKVHPFAEIPDLIVNAPELAPKDEKVVIDPHIPHGNYDPKSLSPYSPTHPQQ